MAAPRFEVVDETEERQPERSERGASILLLALGALSKRTMIALADLFCLLTVGSAFFLWYSIILDPNVLQLVGLGGYATFVLAANWIVRRR